MPEPWDDVAFLRMCSLTEPAWGPWEYEDGPATLIDARDTTVCVCRAAGAGGPGGRVVPGSVPGAVCGGWGVGVGKDDLLMRPMDEEAEARLRTLIDTCKERGETEMVAVLLTLSGLRKAGALARYLPLFGAINDMARAELEERAL